MVKTIPITKARINLGAIVERVRTKGERVILEKGGIPVATLVDMELIEDYEDALELMRVERAEKDEDLVAWDDIRHKYAS